MMNYIIPFVSSKEIDYSIGRCYMQLMYLCFAKNKSQCLYCNMSLKPIRILLHRATRSKAYDNEAFKDMNDLLWKFELVLHVGWCDHIFRTNLWYLSFMLTFLFLSCSDIIFSSYCNIIWQMYINKTVLCVYI